MRAANTHIAIRGQERRYYRNRMLEQHAERSLINVISSVSSTTTGSRKRRRRRHEGRNLGRQERSQSDLCRAEKSIKKKAYISEKQQRKATN